MPDTADEEQWREYHVSPRYLAGSSGVGDAGFAPVAHWPHHHLDDGPCQLLVTSPDQCIRIGWFGDDFLLWKISAAPDAVSPPLWSATFNHTTPAEIVAGLTTALARDYSERAENTYRFLHPPSLYWADSIEPLFDAGWTRGAAVRGTIEIHAPDGQAGALIDNRSDSSDRKSIMLWAGPYGWGTRAEATFTSRTPSHLIAATAAALADPTPVVRYRRSVRHVEHLVTLTPVDPPARPVPTPLEVLRAHAARARTTLTPPDHTPISAPGRPPAAPDTAHRPERHR